MQKYECLFIISASATEADRNLLIEKYKAFLETQKAANLAVEVWGMKKFAYPIDFKKEGFYVLFTFESDAQVPNKLAAQMNISEIVVRFMFTVKE